MVVEKSGLDKLTNFWHKPIRNKNLNNWGQILYGQGKEEFQVNHPGTLLKLLFLWSYMLFPYLHIMARQRYEQRQKRRDAGLFYLDPYAGCGVVKVGNDNGLRIPGSPALALLAPINLHEERRNVKYSYYWDMVILNDNNSDYINDLRKRLDFLLQYVILYDSLFVNQINYFEEDCTNEETWIMFKNKINELKKDNGWVHGLIFIDPPFPSSLRFRFLKKVLTVPSDVIALLHTGDFAENVNKRRFSPKTLASIIDENINEARSLLEQTHSTEELENLYINKFIKILKETKMEGIYKGSTIRDRVIPISIRTVKGHYHLVVALRNTGGKEFQEWFRWVNHMAEEISKMSEVGDIILEILKGKQATIDLDDN